MRRNGALIRAPHAARRLQDQSQPLHHAARNRGHLRRGDLDPLDRHRGRHERAGEGRQRLRCRGCHRLHAAGGRAASQRAGRRRAGDPVRREARQAGGDLRAGAGAGRRDHRALPRARARHDAGHRPAGGLRARHVRYLDAAAARLRHDARWPTCWRRRSATRETAIRWSSARPPPSRWSKACSATIGRPRPRSICRAAKCRRPARCSPTPRSPTLTRAILREAESAGWRARRPDRACAQSLVARLRRRSDRQILPHAGGDGRHRRAPSRRAHRRRHGEVAGDGRSAAHLRLRPLHACARPASGARGRCCCSSLRCSRASISTASIPPGPTSSIIRWSAPSSPSPTARASTAIRISSRCRSRRCCRMPTTPRAASWSPTRPRWNCARARSTGFGVGRCAAPRRGRARRGRQLRRRRADRRPLGRSARRHRAFRHHRPRRQHGVGDAVRRLAAILAGHSRARLRPRHARADVLARRAASGRARARQAAAHHAVADVGAARRRALSGLGHARRRPAGPVDDAVLSAPRPLRA